MGMHLTKSYSGIDYDNTLLLDIYGINNICVNFDFAPSTLVLPILWSFTVLPLLTWCFLMYMVLVGLRRQGALTSNQYCLTKGSIVFVALSYTQFSIIFAVSPTGPNKTMWIHTVPFVILQLGQCQQVLLSALVNQWSYSGTYPK